MRAEITRRGFLSVLGGSSLVTAVAGCTSVSASASRPTSPAAPQAASTAGAAGKNGRVQVTRHTYGSDASQFGELYRPAATPRAGTVVIIHGGFWRAEYGLDLGQPLAADLAERGYTCWNIEYRRIGNGGGWPNTLADVGAAIDLLTSLDVDTAHVVAVGHSAGGQLATWAGGRAGLPAGAPGAAPKVALTGVVSQAGVLDLRSALRDGVGGSAVSDLLGGPPSARAARYRDADPIEQVPLRVPVLCVHGRADLNVPLQQSTAYVTAAKQAGATAVLRQFDGDHFTMIDPDSAAWAAVRDALPSLLTGRLP